ncbi:MAG: hypothetical protein V3T14_13160 [Myxococcota bacterium]
MGEVIVVGGYGRVGLACVRELSETIRPRVVVAGRSVQRAEEAALACGREVRGLYLNSDDPRTMRSSVRDAEALVCCCGGMALEALTLALECRVPFVNLTPLALEGKARAALAEKAWTAQVPIVLGAGAVPGLPGVLADFLVRRMPEVDDLAIVTTGPWRGTETARMDVDGSKQEGVVSSPSGTSAARRWEFPEPVGSWPVKPATSHDLEGFAEAHCVRELSYLEVEPGPLARTALRILGRSSEPERFVAVALARGADRKEARVEIEAADVIQAAATATGVLVRGLLSREVPSGLLLQREAINPTLLLDEMQKREVTVRIGEGLG